MAGVAATVLTDLVLGRYRPLRPLGSGGSGSVWLARDEERGDEVALKIVRREGKAASRAEREAKAAARLRHERCLRSRAFATDDRHVYIAYDYVPGRTLREALRDGQLDEWETVEAAAQILEGLAHAHAHGIVHRDIKPANVLLADDPDVSIRLLDFGLALFDEADTLAAARPAASAREGSRPRAIARSGPAPRGGSSRRRPPVGVTAEAPAAPPAAAAARQVAVRRELPGRGARRLGGRLDDLDAAVLPAEL